MTTTQTRIPTTATDDTTDMETTAVATSRFSTMLSRLRNRESTSGLAMTIAAYPATRSALVMPPSAWTHATR